MRVLPPPTLELKRNGDGTQREQQEECKRIKEREKKRKIRGESLLLSSKNKWASFFSMHISASTLKKINFMVSFSSHPP
ncbi:hypothetical protein D3H55_09835 [Bacillus salacetis]|uniref:Uncharacterized protein n=1 Tax=Bacillus salacetis TaxID=2315464 RepID=A0A3A1R1V3_9BACI|nr:hypothetical protein D3H55_09835 [Bacillus salacetis]